MHIFESQMSEIYNEEINNVGYKNKRKKNKSLLGLVLFKNQFVNSNTQTENIENDNNDQNISELNENINVLQKKDLECVIEEKKIKHVLKTKMNFVYKDYYYYKLFNERFNESKFTKKNIESSISTKFFDFWKREVKNSKFSCFFI